MGTSKDKDKTPYEDEEEAVHDSEESEEINRDAGDSGDEAVSEQPGTEDEDAEEDVSRGRVFSKRTTRGGGEEAAPCVCSLALARRLPQRVACWASSRAERAGSHAPRSTRVCSRGMRARALGREKRRVDAAKHSHRPSPLPSPSHTTPRPSLPPSQPHPTPTPPTQQAVAKAEKKRLKAQAQRKAELLKKMQEEQQQAAAGGAASARQARNRLAFLMRQAEVFQHFAPGAYADGGAAAAAGASASAGGKKGGKKGGGSRGRRAGHDEDDEDAELLRDEDDGGERAGHRLQVQPSCLTGGTLREYQMQGLNWLIHLYDQGINGILADEMVREEGERGASEAFGAVAPAPASRSPPQTLDDARPPPRPLLPRSPPLPP
jgi:hypothetical protein